METASIGTVVDFLPDELKKFRTLDKWRTSFFKRLVQMRQEEMEYNKSLDDLANLVRTQHPELAGTEFSFNGKKGKIVVTADERFPYTEIKRWRPSFLRRR